MILYLLNAYISQEKYFEMNKKDLERKRSQFYMN